jgi:6,7-dimethyl-8-ribityllumazine synthase
MAEIDAESSEPDAKAIAADASWAICVATFYRDLADRLVAGAIGGFAELGADRGRIETFEVPGAFELPLAAKLCADSGRFAGVACLGVVIRGETDHYDFVCAESASGLRQVTLATGVPCSFGVITCDTREQAEARSGGGKRDSGRNAAVAAVRMHQMANDPRLR